VEAVDEKSSCGATWICQFVVYNHDLEITMRIRFWQNQYIQQERKMHREVGGGNRTRNIIYARV